jgi:glycosyltransferase involved in cell wall biosynthesis
VADQKLAVVVPTYRRPESLERCLRGLLAQTHRADEIVVVARHDDDATLRAHARFAHDVRLVTTGAAGQVAALDAGARATEAAVLAFTDDDAVPRADWIARLSRHFTDPAVCGVGGRDIVHHHWGVEEGARATVGTITWWGKPIGNHHLGTGEARSVQILKGCNCAYRREAFAIPLGLRGCGAEPMNDLATSLRASMMGTVVYDADLVVDHYPADRFDGDGRAYKTDRALLDAVHNQAISVLSLLPDLCWRYWAFHLLVGDALTPGLVRSVVAAVRDEPFSRNRFVATQRTVVGAVHEARRHPLRFASVNQEPHPT